MRHAVLLGDSIRLRGYGPLVGSLLGENWDVWQSEDNGRFALYTLQQLQLYRDKLDIADTVHWNNGNWDVDDVYGDGPLVSIEQYKATLTRIARVLEPDKRRVIFAYTLPERPGYKYADNARIRAYNAAARECLAPLGVEFNDLYTLVEPHLDEYIDPNDFIHLTQAGALACAREVAKIIDGK